MGKTKKFIEQLAELVEKDNGFEGSFLQTDLALIIPRGTQAYSLNKDGQVNGLKIAKVSKRNERKILFIISQLEHLERLVLYPEFPLELPLLASLKKLKYISLNNVRKLPKELFETDIPLKTFRDDAKLNFPKSQLKVFQRLRIFKELNPSIKIPFADEELVRLKESELRKRLDELKIDPSMVSEIKMFCSLTERAREKILSDQGVFIINTHGIQDPPFEIMDQGREAIRKYFNEKEKQGVDRLFEAKIVIVGAGESGKTTLIRKLKVENSLKLTT